VRFSCMGSSATVLRYYADGACSVLLNTSSPSKLSECSTSPSPPDGFGSVSARCIAAPDGLAFEVSTGFPAGLVINNFMDVNKCTANLSVSYGYRTNFCYASNPAEFSTLTCNATHYLATTFADSSCSAPIDQHWASLSCESSGGDGSSAHSGKCAASPTELNTPLPIRTDVPLHHGGALSGAGNFMHTPFFAA
jgi:hypothetical protein